MPGLTLTLKMKEYLLSESFQLLHFQSSARSAKKSKDFFGLICRDVIKAVCWELK